MLDPKVRIDVEGLIGHAFSNDRLLELALTHASTAESKLNSNERLEFLGDAVLGLVVCGLVFKHYPRYREGEMTKVKSHAVSRETCALIAKKLGLEKHLILGKGMQGGSKLPASLSAAALESVIGAMYLDGGFEVAARFIEPHVMPVIERTAKSGHQQNFKSVLQQHSQQNWGCAPSYKVMDEQGPDHSKAFRVAVEVNGTRYEATWGQTKKKAEQEAALVALRELGVVKQTDAGEWDVVEEGK